MKNLVTVSLRSGIAMPDGGYSAVLVGFIGERIEAGNIATLGETGFVAQQGGFYLHSDEARGPVKALVYDDAVAGICDCIVPPDDACDLRKLDLDSCQFRLEILRKYQQQLLQPELEESEVVEIEKDDEEDSSLATAEDEDAVAEQQEVAG